MAKVSIDIDYVKDALSQIGYVISDCIERENNGLNWQLKFSNSGACVTIYDTNTKRNTVVNGKCEDGEQEALKELVDGLKCKEISVDTLNELIVSLINSKREESYYDFKEQWHGEGQSGDLLHDILCLANNVENRDAYLIVGVKDNFDVIGVDEWRKTNEIYDFLRSQPFSGGHIPEVELRRMYYKQFKIDVLLIRSSKDVPFFLNKVTREVGLQVYTRVGDTNTPKNQAADYNDVERLWKIHFERGQEI